MEDSSTYQTQTAELLILAFYNGFLALHLIHLPFFTFKRFYQTLWWLKPGYSTEVKCFILEIWTLSFWSQNYTSTPGVPSRFYVHLMSALWFQLLYWIWCTENVRLYLVTLSTLLSLTFLDFSFERNKKVYQHMQLSDTALF